MVSRYDAVLAGIPVPAIAGLVAGHLTGTKIPTALGFLGALLVIGHELLVVGLPE